jgi:hypothetical protein
VERLGVGDAGNADAPGQHQLGRDLGQPRLQQRRGGPVGRDVHIHINGQFYGSPAELARVLKPELARIGSV